MSSVMSLVLDVTAERSAKASLEKMIESLRVLVTNSSEHMLLLDAKEPCSAAAGMRRPRWASDPKNLKGRAGIRLCLKNN